MKMFTKYAKKMWGNRPFANSVFHAIGGIGGGFLLMHYFGFGNVTWGWILVGVALAGHLWAWMSK